MVLELEQKDYGVILGGLAAITVAAYIGHLQEVSPQIEMYIDYLTGAIIIASLAIMYKASDLLGGEIARNLQIMGAGAAIYLVTYYPHIMWHQQRIAAPISDHFGYVFYHGATALAFLLVGYGFYGFYEMGQE